MGMPVNGTVVPFEKALAATLHLRNLQNLWIYSSHFKLQTAFSQQPTAGHLKVLVD